MTSTRTRDGGRSVRLPFVVIALSFLAGRLAVLPLPLPESDVGIYAGYAREHATAAATGQYFYEFHVWKEDGAEARGERVFGK